MPRGNYKEMKLTLNLNTYRRNTTVQRLIACGWMVSNWAFCRDMEIPELKAVIDSSVGPGIPATIIATAKLEAATNVRDMVQMQRRGQGAQQLPRAQ